MCEGRGKHEAGSAVSSALLVAGTSSDAGKSVVVAGICRWLRRQGVSVAPFKAQNMSLNAAVTADGSEIGRAQAAQAAAAGVAPEASMNPVLIKPTGERGAQVVVMGRVLTHTSAAGYQDLKDRLLPVVLDALEHLRSRFDVVICEGAGGIAEINLRQYDLANLGLARAASLPVVVVGDIDRGGVFASLFGSLALLDPEDQALVRAFLVNKFRGDVDLLEPGIAELQRRTGRSVLGVLPWVRGLDLDAEDSLALEAPRRAAPVPGGATLLVAVVRLPCLSNFTDVDPLAAEPGVEVRFTDSATELAAADLAVLPGTKATVADLVWLRSHGLDAVLAERARSGEPVLGICGGYQMLGRCLDDGVESGAGPVEGLELLPVETVFEPDKVLARPSGLAPSFGATRVDGYEIHHGRVRRHGGDLVFVVDGAGGEGCRSGVVVGTSWHGVFESDAFRRAFCSWVASVRGVAWIPGTGSFADAREARLDLLGDLIADHVDGAALLGLIDGSNLTSGGAGLPVVTTGLAN
jgi:adenosylcobyric acid synthase